MILRDVRRNKIKTGLIVTLFFVFITMLVYFISRLFFENTAMAVAFGLIFASGLYPQGVLAF